MQPVNRWDATGLISTSQVEKIGAFIASQQDANGALPWFTGGQLDPWDHVEAVMGLTVAGRYDEAMAGLLWSARNQRPDGSWPMLQTNGVVQEEAADTNQCAYIAVGVWHYYLATGQAAALARLWPTVESAINFAVRGQLPSGAISWALSADRQWDSLALLTGSSSTLQAMECACLIAETLGHDRPRWRVAGRALRDAIRHRPEEFADRSRYSMDWYYPVLTGALRGEAARQRIDGAWDGYYWPGRGVRCVRDEPWVTAAETVELVAALDAMGDHDRAVEVFEQVQFLYDPTTGGYWTGKNIPNDQVWPVEQTTWSAAAMLLAADALTQTTGAASIFRDAGSWTGWGGALEGAAS
ncbi:prenyltransferase [Yimella sp. cx-51]|uniref:prenyltransferase n=1 Tax=Yimella sp. cx-51 TaxID=2770551 RepID=UPI00165E406E|nr:prenyltransferase [Yimella sp. cx-51]MBC9955546.1 prenyltransferase [Yimella sp. cx-51]QTH37872.1 prenyltransferase [Yimella sp. cx-51]